MAKSPAMNIQDSFLNQVRKDGTEVKIALLDGNSITGTIRGFDNFTVIVNCRGAQHLLYKHAIAQVISHRPARREGEQEDSRGAGQRQGEGAPKPQQQVEAKKAEAFNPIDLSGLHADKNA